MKILQTGDWHLGSYNGPTINGQNARFNDICLCLDALVMRAMGEQPDFIIIAGDLFHQARVWSDRGLRESQTAISYIRQLESVAPVIIVRGTPNHDSIEQYRSLETAFEGDDSVHIFTKPEVLKVYGYHGEKLNVAALPGFDRGYFRAKHPDLDKEEETAVFTKALENIIIGLKAQCEPGIPSVLVGHYTITGANTESGQTAMFAQYEPVVEPSTLRAADFDLNLFGHIHRPQQIEGCSNAFYCGAVSQLNFNDEGQKRGFYLHSIHEVPTHEPGAEPPIPAYGHAFVELPTREFKTIRLEDGDIKATNEGLDIIRRYDVAGKIVRVLYNCTDENNKALNKTMLEQRLYELGAFWVQEITPEKISITVSKDSLDGETGPEENLKAYLEEKGAPEADAGRIIERARPIISEAEEAHMTAHTSGVFLPVEIEVKNYRNYREEKFSYEGIRFCTINGANGAGKSSLFMDALCDALFEETREGDIGGWISNDQEARSGIIKFTFKLGEATYRVTRTRMKSGKATLNLAENVDGEWVDRSKEKFRDTQAEILNVIGMDSLTLKATALIMQDQYGLFLTADKEARMTILGNILGLGAYGDMEEIAARKLTDTNREIRITQEKAADITEATPDEEELKEAISEREEIVKRLESEIAAKRSEADGMKLAISTMEEAQKRAAKLEDRIGTAIAKRAAATTQISKQKEIVADADCILEMREEIEAAVEEHKRLLAREKELLAAIGDYKSLKKQIRADSDAALSAMLTAQDYRHKQYAVDSKCIIPLQETLEKEPELAEAHKQYAAAQAEYESIRSKGDAWREAQAAVAAALSDVTQARMIGVSRVNAAEDGLSHLRKRAQLLEENACPHAETVRCAFLKDALEAKESIPDAEAALEERKQQARKTLDEAQETLEAAKRDVPKDYTPEAEKEAIARLRALEGSEKQYIELAAKKKELEAAQERSADLGKMKREAEARFKELDEKVQANKRRVEEIGEPVKEYEEIQERIGKLARAVDAANRIPVAEEKKTTAEARIKEITAEIEALDAETKELTEERAEELAKTAGSQEMVQKYESAMKTIKGDEACMQAANMEIGAIKESLKKAEQARKQVEELMQQAAVLGTEAADLEILKTAFSQDGIPHNIVRSIIPIFEATATNILGQMSGGHMSVEFVMEKTLKSNSKKEVTALDVVVNDALTGRLPYTSRSGGERVKAALAVILALAEIKNTKASVQPGFLFIDEPAFLDNQGVEAYCDALEAIQRRYPHLIVMAITHDMEFKARFPQSITVTKDETGSHIRMD
ncbi:MAG: metallophosphoesterase [Lachnospiraceae bacterium]|nr:metallophosphoesterase [Lachnospiraceae bacterium]